MRRNGVILFNFGHIFCVEAMWSVEFISELSIEEAATRHTLDYDMPCYLTHVHPTDQLLITANTSTHLQKNATSAKSIKHEKTLQPSVECTLPRQYHYQCEAGMLTLTLTFLNVTKHSLINNLPILQN